MEELVVHPAFALFIYFCIFVLFMAIVAGVLSFLGVIFEFVGFLFSLLYYIPYGVYKLLEFIVKKIKSKKLIKG